MTAVALFVPRLVDTLFPAPGRATVEVLERLGVEVSFPEEQTCCGQMHANSGHRADALALARRFVSVRPRRAAGSADLRGQAAGGLGGVAGREARPDRRLGGAGVHGRRRLVPHAHRRRAATPRVGVRAVHLAEILAAT